MAQWTQKATHFFCCVELVWYFTAKYLKNKNLNVLLFIWNLFPSPRLLIFNWATNEKTKSKVVFTFSFSSNCRPVHYRPPLNLLLDSAFLSPSSTSASSPYLLPPPAPGASGKGGRKRAILRESELPKVRIH